MSNLALTTVSAAVCGPLTKPDVQTEVRAIFFVFILFFSYILCQAHMRVAVAYLSRTSTGTGASSFKDMLAAFTADTRKCDAHTATGV